VLLSFCGITIHALIQDFFPDNPFLVFFREGLIVGGWVFLWEAFSMLFIQLDDVYQSLNMFKRLLNCKIVFSYPSLIE